MSLLLPIGLESSSNDATSGLGRFGKGLVQSMITYLFVNPEKMQLKRNASIAETRTMAGTVFQPWPNMPDEVEFSGILYGTRAILESVTLHNAIPSSPDNKEIKLIYKWRKYRGYIKSLSISADVDRPRVYNYTFTFVSKDAMELWRLMIGQLTGTTAETAFLASQASAASDAARAESLNTLSVAVAATTSILDKNITPLDLGVAATRSAILFLLGNGLKVNKRRLGSF